MNPVFIVSLPADGSPTTSLPPSVIPTPSPDCHSSKHCKAIDHNPLEHVGDRVLQALPNLNELSTPEFRFCCLPHHANVCLPRTEEFSSCEDLMSNLVLRVFVWVVGFVALVGNTSVIVWRLLYPSGSKKVCGSIFFLLFLAFFRSPFQQMVLQVEQLWQ
ncbi:G-protein coupled receptor GRL101 [Chionoecetes opilio]|uniref:G-protein coupled receptor GRL101 n=1 Tax=Chionoecetes opilio TaxID=41210 RepID=A0A8J4YEB7_CHIOP|nr:G-protein coupled receptor GRL101 [Chionoecetes opilio]